MSLNQATELLHQPNEDAAGQIWRLNRSDKQTKSDPVSLDDAAAQIWGFFHSGKQIKPDPTLRPSSRHSATNSLPVSHLKDRPLPPPSTLTPALPSPSPARRSMPSTMTPYSDGDLLFICTSETKLGSCLLRGSEPSGSVPTPFPLPPTTTASIPIINSSPYCRHAATFICPSKVNLGFPLLGLSFHFGPLSKSRPITKRTGPFSVNDWPRYVLLSPSQLQPNFSDLSGRRHHLRRKSITLQWSCVYHPSILSQISSMAKVVDIKILQEVNSAEKIGRKHKWKARRSSLNHTSLQQESLETYLVLLNLFMISPLDSSQELITCLMILHEQPYGR